MSGFILEVILKFPRVTGWNYLLLVMLPQTILFFIQQKLSFKISICKDSAASMPQSLPGINTILVLCNHVEFVHAVSHHFKSTLFEELETVAVNYSCIKSLNFRGNGFCRKVTGVRNH